MKKDELDRVIAHALEERVSDLEASSGMLEQIRREANQRRKESVSMKLFTPKRIAAVAILCFASVTCYAAVNLAGTVGHSNNHIQTYAKLEQGEETVGFDMKTIESFSNGFVFKNGGTGETYGVDEAGNPIGEAYQSLSVSYEKDGKWLVVTAQNGDPNVDAGQSAWEGYSSQLYKFVPPDYQLTEEDLEREASGELVISYGSAEVEESQMENYFWQDGGLYYSMTAQDCQLGEEGMTQMVQELMASND